MNRPIESIIDSEFIDDVDAKAITYLTEHEELTELNLYGQWPPSPDVWLKNTWLNRNYKRHVDLYDKFTSNGICQDEIFSEILNDLIQLHSPSKQCAMLAFVNQYFKQLEARGDANIKVNPLYPFYNIDFDIREISMKEFARYRWVIAQMNRIHPQMCGSIFEAWCAYAMRARYDNAKDIELLTQRPDLLEFFNNAVFKTNKGIIDIEDTLILGNPNDYKHGLFSKLLGRAAMHYFSFENSDVTDVMQTCYAFNEFYVANLHRDDTFAAIINALERDFKDIYASDYVNETFESNRSVERDLTIDPDTNSVLHIKGVMDIYSWKNIIDCKVYKGCNEMTKLTWFYQLLMYFYAVRDGEESILHTRKKFTIIDGWNCCIHYYHKFRAHGEN